MGLVHALTQCKLGDSLLTIFGVLMVFLPPPSPPPPRDVGIPEMLDVEDMVTVKIPDAKSIMTFLVTIYQHFNS